MPVANDSSFKRQVVPRQPGTPATLKEFGVNEEEFLASLDGISENSVSDPCTGTNPREISVAQMKELFRKAYYGMS